MPAILANADKFRSNSDYPIDKVIFIRSGSFAAGASASGTETITHGLPFIPLYGGYWSTTSDFSVVYEFGSGPFPGPPGTVFSVVCDEKATSTEIQLPWLNNSTTTTIYYRVYGLQPKGVTGDVAPTANAGDTFTLNSDYNYMKLYLEDNFTQGTTSSVVVPHSLGAIPRVRAWYMSGSTLLSCNAPDSTFGAVLYAVPSTTTVAFENPSAANLGVVYYRIYI